MNLHHVIAKDIIGWIRDFHSGLKKNYLLCKDDTKTTIGLLKNLPYVALTTEMEVFDWFENELDMDMSNTRSLYRAFIVYNRDEIVNLRVSTHYSTKSSFRNAAAAKGESEFEYHIIITRTPLALKSDSITGDMMIDSTEIFVAEIQLCDFLSNPSERWKTISKLIKLLTDGTSMNESKSKRTSTNIKTIRITETELKGIIAESVKRILSVASHKIGNWERVPSNGYEFHDIPSKGKCVGIAMYVDNTTNETIPPTYCLFRRGSNGKYFYATIIGAPEKGTKETKFLTVPVSNVPQEIRKDLHNLNLLS